MPRRKKDDFLLFLDKLEKLLRLADEYLEFQDAMKKRKRGVRPPRR